MTQYFPIIVEQESNGAFAPGSQVSPVSTPPRIPPRPKRAIRSALAATRSLRRMAPMVATACSWPQRREPARGGKRQRPAVRSYG